MQAIAIAFHKTGWICKRHIKERVHIEVQDLDSSTLVVRCCTHMPSRDIQKACRPAGSRGGAGRALAGAEAGCHPEGSTEGRQPHGLVAGIRGHHGEEAPQWTALALRTVPMLYLAVCNAQQVQQCSPSAPFQRFAVVARPQNIASCSWLQCVVSSWELGAGGRWRE